MPCYHRKVYIDKHNNFFFVKYSRVHKKFKVYVKTDNFVISISGLPGRDLVEDAQEDLDSFAALNEFVVLLDDREGEKSEVSQNSGNIHYGIRFLPCGVNSNVK